MTTRTTWWSLLALALLLGGSGCPGAGGPADDAVNEYLARNGQPPTLSSPGSDPERGVLMPVAKRVVITVESGTGLPDTDGGPGETDPYVIVEYEGLRYETSVVEGELEPVWGDSFIFDVHPGGVMVVSLMDEDALASDDKLGVVSQPLSDVRVGETVTLELPFRGGEGGTVRLTVTGLERP